MKSEFNKYNFGKRIQKELDRKGMTQQELANRLKVTESLISQITAGKKGTSLEKLFEIAEILNVSTDYLLGRTNFRNIIKTNTNQGNISVTGDNNKLTDIKIDIKN